MSKKLSFQEDKELVIVGFDSEWVEKTSNNQVYNEVLSYQFFGVSVNDISEKTWHYIFYPIKKTRFALKRLLSRFLEMGVVGGSLKKWPKAIYAVAHWTLADLTKFSDFHCKQKFLFEAVQKTLITVGQPPNFKMYDSNRHKHSCCVTLCDTMLLSPQGKNKLADLGELLHLPKIILPAGMISQMDRLLEENFQLFEQYALRDAEISAKYLLHVKKWSKEKIGKNTIPKTIGGLAVSYFLKIMKDQNMDYLKLFGLETVNEEKWNTSKNCYIKTKKNVITSSRYIYESFAKEAYYGGRNETYCYGASEEDNWNDWDLTGAYSTAMAMLGMPDYDNARPTRDIEDFQPRTLGFASVEFRFPKNTRFPCLPVRASNGLIFPLEGKTACPSPEIYLAKRMGAKIDIIHGIVIPTDSNIEPFANIMSEIQKEREKLTKGTLEDLLIKALGNTLYGKIAQGLGEKRVFDNHTAESKSIKPCKLTNPYIASFITSVIRAAVSEIISLVNESVTVISATTDGFISNATDDEIEIATQGPICNELKRTRYQLVGKKEILEKKHKVKKLLSWRTRGQATIEEVPGEEKILAKAGLKEPIDEDPNKWIIEQFENRNPETKQETKSYRPLRDIIKNGGDLIKEPNTRKVGMDWDWKRNPINIEMRKVLTKEHVYFETEPWKNIDEYDATREQWGQYKNHKAGILKTEEDLKKFEDYKASSKAPRKGINRDKKSGSIKIAIRQFLRAYVRQEMGLTSAMKYPELLKWLNEGGYECTLNTIKNSKRDRLKLESHSVPNTQETKKFFQFVKEKFPNFTPERLLEEN